MTLILSGTNGVSDIDGDASTPALRGTDANSGVFFGSDVVGVSTGGTEHFRVNAGGQILVGAGAAATPTLANSSDTDTGVYFGSGVVNIATGGALRAQIDGANLSLGGARNGNGFESRYPARLLLWGDTSFISNSVRLVNYKTNVSTGVATDIFSFTKGAGSLSSDVYANIGGRIKISIGVQVTGGVNAIQYVEIPFSLACPYNSNFVLVSGSQTTVTGFSNTSAPTYALSLSATSNTAATMALTVTRAGLANNDIAVEIDAIAVADGASRTPYVAVA